MNDKRSRPRASVILQTRDRAPYLERTLASWLQQGSSDHELILVDNGSADDTPEVIARYAPRLPLRAVRTENLSRSAAHNRAIELARGDILLLSGYDNLVHPDFVRAHAEAFGGAFGEGPEPVVLGAPRRILAEVHARGTETGSVRDLSLYHRLVVRLLSVRPELIPRVADGQGFDAFGVSEIEGDLLGIVELLSFDGSTGGLLERALRAFDGDLNRCSYAWAFATTGNMSFSRRAFASVGGFDERIVGWLSNIDLHYRLTRAGAPTRLVAAASYRQNHQRDGVHDWLDWLRDARRMLDHHQDIAIPIWLAATLAQGSGVSQLEPELFERDQLIRQLRQREGTPLARVYQQILEQNVRKLLDEHIRNVENQVEASARASQARETGRQPDGA